MWIIILSRFFSTRPLPTAPFPEPTAEGEAVCWVKPVGRLQTPPRGGPGLSTGETGSRETVRGENDPDLLPFLPEPREAGATVPGRVGMDRGK